MIWTENCIPDTHENRLLLFSLFYITEAGKFKAMVDNLQRILLQRCDKEGNY